MALIVLLVGWWAARLVLRSWRARRPEPSPSVQGGIDLLRDRRRDPLTGLLSRQSLMQALEARLAGAPIALIVLDLDRFAALNEAYGHHTGDEVLVAVAGRLRALLPASQLVGRLGGDQFGILMAAEGGLGVVEAACLRLLRAMMTPLPVGVHPREYSIGISLGIALAPSHGRDPDGLLQSALGVLAEVKAAGGGAWRIFDPARRGATRQRALLGQELHDAIEGGRILPYYQPIIDLRSRALTGLEVLARWQHPTLGLLQPSAFIGLAEEAGLTGRLTANLLRRVMADSRWWPPSLHFAFNTPPGQLREMIGLVCDPPDWPEGRLDAGRIEVGVTGSAIVEDVAVTGEILRLLQDRGVRVALVDFGNGAPNFGHLRDLHFDRLKIDRSFVAGMEGSERARSCMRAIAALTESLGVTLAADGIETEAAADFLSDLGCRYGQGFLFSEAVPGSEMAGLVGRPVPARTDQLQKLLLQG